ncbi:siderophore-interacting protein [Verticiella sediminum]|uniref:Siderophore-interacting protein n=1 Tax=Verticiella sediminum TaxID=1247510 RepID=A0A556AS47_9BURK|nr:MucB/RseB C-terminal domain-containing protein [Verticiella sediminum]TSH95740.1 siderophore-interacting protein [Verticiella sediminum]
MALTLRYRLPNRAWRSALALLLAACCVHVSVQAAESDPRGVELMEHMKRAAHALDYAGVFTYQQGAVMASSQVAHVVDKQGERQRVETLDGRPHREFLRLNDEVRSIYPELRMVLVEKRETEHFPVFFHGEARTLAQHYAITLEDETGRVAGRACRVLHVQPRDDARWGYELCVDEASGLLLKAQTVDASGAVLEQVAFSEVRIGKDVDPALVEPRHDISAWREVQPGDPVDLLAAGWRIPAPQGFVPLSQMERTLKHDKHVRQMLLSDGIAAISVFIENRRGADSRTPGPTEYGATSVYCRQLDDFWLTVIGEVPLATVQGIANAIEFIQ